MVVVKGVCKVNVDGRQTSEWLHVGSVWAGEVLTHPLQDLEVDGVARPSAFALGRHGDLAGDNVDVGAESMSSDEVLPSNLLHLSGACGNAHEASMHESAEADAKGRCMATAASAWRGRIQAARGDVHSMATHSHKLTDAAQ
jgi:hypothetical protein